MGGCARPYGVPAGTADDDDDDELDGCPWGVAAPGVHGCAWCAAALGGLLTVMTAPPRP